ncbi:hypothetical protein [Streptomyces chartreusis]|uniref:hypothetical protein n=1 Tax=Streptomyces chartreusis TaxID=1969 RepID=UPI00381484F5
MKPGLVSPQRIAYLDRASDIIGPCKELGASAVQVHGDIKIDELQRMRNISPELIVINSLVIRGQNLEELDAIIMETSTLVHL